MKTLTSIIAGLMLLVSVGAGAQSLKKTIPEGSKVFVMMPGNQSNAQAVKSLNNWGFWKIVSDKNDADFKMKISFERKPMGMGHSSCKAEFTDKKNDVVYYTEPVTFGGSDNDLVMHLINKRIIKDKN